MSIYSPYVRFDVFKVLFVDGQRMSWYNIFLQEKRIAEGVVEDMTDEQKSSYLHLKDMNNHMLKQLTEGQRELDDLSTRRRELELDISASQVRLLPIQTADSACPLFSRWDESRCIFMSFCCDAD